MAEELVSQPKGLCMGELATQPVCLLAVKVRERCSSLPPSLAINSRWESWPWVMRVEELAVSPTC